MASGKESAGYFRWTALCGFRDPMGISPQIDIWAWPLFAGLLAVLIYVLSLRSGIEVNADGWAYWQGGQSIADGLGYRYFSGHPIVAWPPLYSLYLSAWIKLWGPEAFVLIVSNGVLIFLQSVAWTLLCYLFVKGHQSEGSLKYVAIYIALTTSLYERGALAHNLFYAILPVFIGASWKAKRLGLACASGVALVESHISGLAYVAAAALMVLFNGRGPLPNRAISALAILLAPTLALTLTAWRLDQFGGHPMEGGRFSIAQNLLQVCDAIGSFVLLHPGSLPGLLCMTITCGILVSFAIVKKASSLLSVVAFAGVAVLLVAIAFSITWLNGFISDPRHLLIIPLLIFPGVIVCLLSFGTPVARTTALLIFVTPVWRLLSPDALVASGNLVPIHAAISPIPGFGRTATINGKLLVGPIRWEEPQGGYSATGAPRWGSSQAELSAR